MIPDQFCFLYTVLDWGSLREEKFFLKIISPVYFIMIVSCIGIQRKVDSSDDLFG